MRPTPSPPDLTAKGLAAHLKSLAMAGDRKAFGEAVGAYLDAHRHDDPRGRELFRETRALFSPLSFRVGTSREEDARQERKRWEMWMGVLPLDHQIELLHREARDHNLGNIPFDMLKWEQRQALWESRLPGEALPQSPLGEDDQSLEQRLEQVATHCQIVASSLIAWKQWDVLDAWMGQAQIHPWEGMGGLYLHYTDDFSHGAQWASLPHVLPFWAAGLYALATDEAYWQVMARHGGPDRPMLEPAPGEAVQALKEMHKEAGDGRRLDLQAPQSALPNHPSFRKEGIAQARATGKAWQARRMDEALPLPAPLAPPRRRL